MREDTRPLGEPTAAGSASPANPIDGLYPGPGLGVFEVEEGGYLGRLINTDSSPPPTGVSTWLEMTSVFASFDAEAETVRWARLGRDTEGVLLLSSVNPRRDLETVFDPPLRLAPTSLSVGQTHEHSTALTLVAPASQPEQAETTGGGTARVSTTRLPAERVTTPLGTFDADRIDVRLELDLDSSRVARLARYAISGDRIVMIDSSQTVRAMGFTVSRERRTARLCCDDDSSG